MTVKKSIGRKFDEVLYKAIRLSIAFLLTAMFVIIIMEVIFRYVVAAPAFWTEELARYIMFYMVLLGSAIAIREERHPSLTFIIQQFPEKFQKVWNILIDSVVFIVLLVMLKEGYFMAVDEMIMKTPALRVSFFWVYLAFPIGTILMMLQIIVKYIFGKKSEPGQ
jgi:TRAP-type C4-dicarboxylate transport system permease small subunit